MTTPKRFDLLCRPLRTVIIAARILLLLHLIDFSRQIIYVLFTLFSNIKKLTIVIIACHIVRPAARVFVRRQPDERRKTSRVGGLNLINNVRHV